MKDYRDAWLRGRMFLPRDPAQVPSGCGCVMVLIFALGIVVGMLIGLPR